MPLAGKWGKSPMSRAFNSACLMHKGPAVWAPRAQADKVAYQFEMKHRLEKTPISDIKQGTMRS